jgi:hypothetical protein
MSRFPARYCFTGCGTILARENQYSEKHTSIHEYENKNFPRKRLPFRKRLRVLSGGRFRAGKSGLVENPQVALVTRQLDQDLG